jgi:hypothetical protein
LLALVTLALLGCASTGTPSGVFDAYFEAYSAGDTDQLWELSSPAARADARRVQRELVANLQSADVERRTFWEGQFGVEAADIENLGEQDFFVWAVRTIRRRIGITSIHSLVSRIQRVKEEAVNADLTVVIYRVGEEVSRLPIIKTPDGWRVDQSPFPPAPDPNAPPPEAPVSPTPPSDEEEEEE